MTSPKQRKKVVKPRAARQARRTADVGPARYRADTDHEIEQGGGVVRVSAGDYVLPADDGSVTVMPPERYREAFPDRAEG